MSDPNLPPGIDQRDIDDPEPDDEWEQECRQADEEEGANIQEA